MAIRIPKTMSTQHPDNVASPFFAANQELGGDDEIKEAFYAYSHLKCTEQLWDCEGKETDNYVVKKLLTGYEPYFTNTTLGEDVFLTLRVPNPAVERSEAKILLETLESIPRSYDTAKLFYGKDVAPVFEVALPMATDRRQLLNIARYYRRHVAGKKDASLGGTTVGEWIGEFKPEQIRVIPLFEDKESMLGSADAVRTLITEEKIEDHQRVWLARSDPALNYGSLASVLIEKVALQRLHSLQEELSVPLYPILGCGSAPFRGNLRPDNAGNSLKGYPSVHTFTLQSAFKYDYPVEQVEKAVATINEAKTGKPFQVDEEKALGMVERLTASYQRQITELAPLINDVSSYIPPRRKRKLHIGLFGYSRQMGQTQLPRAIKFCGALYSLGIPPDLLGLDALTAKDLELAHAVYPSFEQDLKDALQYLNVENFRSLAPAIYEKIQPALSLVDYEVDRKHEKVTGIILDNYKTRYAQALKENITRAGFIRKFLG